MKKYFAIVSTLFCLFLTQPLLAQTTKPTNDSPKKPEPVFVDANTLDVEGRAYNDLVSPYDRLPTKAQKMVRDPVWGLSHDSAGIVVRFISDSPTISVRWTLNRTNLAMHHMSSIGVSGMDLYLKTSEHKYMWVGSGAPTGVNNTVQITSNLPNTPSEYMLYLPLYNGVKSVEVGVAPGSTISKAQARADKPIVFYGTSITQGACASRPGMCHTAILGRWFDRPVVNLGFSGNGRMEMPFAELLSDIDAAVYVVDCLPNMLNAPEVTANGKPFLDALRKLKPITPIVLVESLSYPRMYTDSAKKKQVDEHRAALRAIYEQAIKDGDKNLYYLDGDQLILEDGEGTVDGTHPTDLGFYRQAQAFEKVLKPLLEQK